MDKTVWPLSFLVLVSILLSFSVRGLEFDYDDLSVNSTTASKPANATRNDTYPDIAKRLNCSKLVLSHKGVKLEAVRSDSIFKAPTIQRVGVSTTKPKVTTTSTTTPASPPPSDEFTIPPEIFDSDFEGGMPIPPGKSDFFGVSEDDPDPIAALLAQDAQEDPDPIAALLGQQTPTSNQQPRKLATGHEKNKLGSKSDNRQESGNKKETPPHVDDGNKKPPPTVDDDDDDTTSSTKTKKKNSTTSTITHDCAYAFDDDGTVVRWYEVIAQNGGEPGAVNATRLKPKKTKVLEPCHRPVTNTTLPLQDLLYEYKLIEYEKVYRHEKAFQRFSGTPSQFVDVIGQLVWAPPGFERRYFRLYYRKDDTGFYVSVRKRQKCVFEKQPLTVSCTVVQDFTPCADNSTLRSLSPGLQASLIG